MHVTRSPTCLFFSFPEQDRETWHCEAICEIPCQVFFFFLVTIVTVAGYIYICLFAWRRGNSLNICTLFNVWLEKKRQSFLMFSLFWSSFRTSAVKFVSDFFSLFCFWRFMFRPVWTSKLRGVKYQESIILTFDRNFYMWQVLAVHFRRWWRIIVEVYLYLSFSFWILSRGFASRPVWSSTCLQPCGHLYCSFGPAFFSNLQFIFHRHWKSRLWSNEAKIHKPWRAYRYQSKCLCL